MSIQLDTMRKFLDLITMRLASFIRKVNRKGLELNNYQLFFKEFHQSRMMMMMIMFRSVIVCEDSDQLIKLIATQGKGNVVFLPT